MKRWVVREEWLMIGLLLLVGDPVHVSFGYYRWRWLARLHAWSFNHLPMAPYWPMRIRATVLGRATKKTPPPN